MVSHALLCEHMLGHFVLIRAVLSVIISQIQELVFVQESVLGVSVVGSD